MSLFAFSGSLQSGLLCFSRKKVCSQLAWSERASFENFSFPRRGYADKSAADSREPLLIGQEKADGVSWLSPLPRWAPLSPLNPKRRKRFSFSGGCGRCLPKTEALFASFPRCARRPSCFAGPILRPSVRFGSLSRDVFFQLNPFLHLSFLGCVPYCHMENSVFGFCRHIACGRLFSRSPVFYFGRDFSVFTYRETFAV